MSKFFLLILFSLVGSLSFGQKKVLVEKFTNPFCGQCPNASIIIDDLIAAYPGTIRANHHKPVDWIDNPMNNAASQALWEDLNVPGVPSAMIDRSLIGGSLINSSGSWENGIVVRMEEEPYVILSLEDLAYEGEERTLSFSVSTGFETLPPEGTYRLSVIIVEDSVRGVEQHSYYNDVAGHPLEGLGDIIWNYRHMDVVRTILDEHWGTPGSIPDDRTLGQVVLNEYTYTIPDEFDPHNLRILCLISAFDQSLASRGEILNAEAFRLRDYDLRTSVEDPLRKDDRLFISVAPNPTSNLVSVKFASVPESLMLITLTGDFIWRENISIKEHSFSTEQINDGVYYLIASFEGEHHAYPLLVKH